MTTFELPDLLEHHGHRLQGISSWSQLEHVGKNNLSQLHFWLQDITQQAFHAGEDRLEMRQRAQALHKLKVLAERNTDPKPFLPKLRRETFRIGDELMIYLGDTPNAHPTNTSKNIAWTRASVLKIEKANRAQWRYDSKEQGYFWKVIAQLEGMTVNGEKELAFSTSEPRVLQRAEMDFLLQARQLDNHFYKIYCENAQRSWQPLWNIDAGFKGPVKEMNLDAWLTIWVRLIL